MAEDRHTIGPDGPVYVTDSGNHLVCAIGTDGVIRTVAGTGQDGAASPEPAPDAKATDVPLAFPYDLAIGRDGTLFIADGGHGPGVRALALRDITRGIESLRRPSMVSDTSGSFSLARSVLADATAAELTQNMRPKR